MEKLGHGISRKMMDQRRGIQIYGGQALGRMEPSILCCDPVGMVMSQGETALRLQEKCQGKFKMLGRVKTIFPNILVSG